MRDGKVVGVGDTASEAAEQAHQDDPEESFILEAVDHDADVIYAGLIDGAAVRPGTSGRRGYPSPTVELQRSNGALSGLRTSSRLGGGRIIAEAVSG